MAGLPELRAEVAALQAKVAPLQASLAALEDNLAALAAANRGVPELTDLTVQALTSVNQVVGVLQDWSDGTTSRTYIAPELPPAP